MDEDLIRTLRRWKEADDDGLDDEADAACRALFAEAAMDRPLSLDFAARTMQAIDVAAVADRRRHRLVRKGLIGGGIAAAIGAAFFGGPWAVAAISRLTVGVLDLLLGATVRIASGVQAGADVWSLLSNVGRAVAAFVSDPSVTFVMLAMQGIAIAALFALQRLLGSDTESFK
jgi:hypothetical protein